MKKNNLSLRGGTFSHQGIHEHLIRPLADLMYMLFGNENETVNEIINTTDEMKMISSFVLGMDVNSTMMSAMKMKMEVETPEILEALTGIRITSLDNDYTTMQEVLSHQRKSQKKMSDWIMSREEENMESENEIDMIGDDIYQGIMNEETKEEMTRLLTQQ